MKITEEISAMRTMGFDIDIFLIIDNVGILVQFFRREDMGSKQSRNLNFFSIVYSISCTSEDSVI